MNNVLSNNLKKFRQQKKYTQQQAAEILGVSTHTVSRWECDTTLPDVTLLPEIAKIYCVSIDDLFKESSVAYENYAQRLASIFEETKEPEDFVRADIEFKKIIKSGKFSLEDLRTYGTLHHIMMRYSIHKAIELFDKALERDREENFDVFWKTNTQKMLLLSEIGRSKESIESYLASINKENRDSIDWRCLIEAYIFDRDYKSAFNSFKKAITIFPTDPVLYVLGGDICKKLGKYEEALSYWDRALEIDNKCDEARYSKLEYYEQIGNHEVCRLVSLEIIDNLRQSGLEIEANGEEKRLNRFLTQSFLDNH